MPRFTRGNQPRRRDRLQSNPPWLDELQYSVQPIYSGQLATELTVQSLGHPPSVEIQRTVAEVRLAWPASLTCYTLESSEDLNSPRNWAAVADLPTVENGWFQLRVYATYTMRWFRLKQASASKFPPSATPSPQ